MFKLLTIAFALSAVPAVAGDVAVSPACDDDWCGLCPVSSSGGHITMYPDGSGNSLEGSFVSLSLHVLCNGDPISGYPFQDVWLGADSQPNVNFCTAVVADANSDASGYMELSGTPAGGGYAEDGLRVFVGGIPLNVPPLEISINSPDIDADGRVNLNDLATFAIDFNDPAYDFRSDFHFDGQENLNDVSRMAIAMGTSCP